MHNTKKISIDNNDSNMHEKHNCHCCGIEIRYDGICWKCKEKQKRDRILALTENEINNICLEIVKRIEALDMNTAKYSDEYDAIGDLISLLAYHDVDILNIAKAACDKKLYSFPLIYRNAPSDIRDRLIDELLDPDCEDPGNIQTCLAHIDDDEVLKVFMQLEKDPLPWRKNLHVNPSVYAEAGGWSFDEEGRHQNLIYDMCYSMHMDPDSEDRSVQIGKKRDDTCKVCGGILTDILILNGKDKRLSFLGIDGTLRIPFCTWCGCFTEENIVRYELDGASDYSVTVDPRFKENKLPPKYLDEMDSNRYVLDEGPSLPLRSYGYPQEPAIGGIAEWIQDWTFMRCPDCNKKMKYLASIPWECISDGFEGKLYIEICTDCKVVKLLHQQT